MQAHDNENFFLLRAVAAAVTSPSPSLATPLQPSLVYCNWPGPPMYHRACPRPRLATGKFALSPSHRQSPHDDIYSIYTISGTSYFTPGFALENALKWTSDGPVTLQLLNILHKLLKGSR